MPFGRIATAKVISGGGWAAARSALCAKGCESRARGLVSVTARHTSLDTLGQLLLTASVIIVYSFYCCIFAEKQSWKQLST